MALLDRTVLVNLIATLTGIPTVLESDPRPFVDPTAKGIAIVSVRTTGAHGWDDARAVYDTPSDGLVWTQCGTRRATLTVRVEQFPTAPSKWAYDVLETLRMRIQRDTSLATLRAANMALIDYEDTQDLELFYDDHRVTAATMDVILAAAVTDSDPTQEGGYIKIVQVTDDQGHTDTYGPP